METKIFAAVFTIVSLAIARYAAKASAAPKTLEGIPIRSLFRIDSESRVFEKTVLQQNEHQRCLSVDERGNVKEFWMLIDTPVFLIDWPARECVGDLPNGRAFYHGGQYYAVRHPSMHGMQRCERLDRKGTFKWFPVDLRVKELE